MNRYEQWAETVMDDIRKKYDWVSEKNKLKIPYTTDPDGNYDDRSDPTKEWTMDNGLNWWTNGFWGGILWLLYQDTNNQKYAEIARISENRMEQCLVDFYGIHHDVGFMFQPTAVADYRLTGNENSRRVALHAANLLAGRFNPNGRYLRAWNDLPGKDTRGWAIIDCMFNISLLYWATEETKDPRFRQIAMLHADTVLQNFIRPDGSVEHVVEFNPETGEKIRGYGGQGYADGSSWARGQGWAIYGFMISYVHTKKSEYLNAAKRVAHYCMANISESGIIPIDFRQPNEPVLEDSCGACVIAGGLLEIAKQVPVNEKEMYYHAAYNILKAIYETRSDWTANCDAIVQNCSAAYHSPVHHTTMVYADYYFIEAVMKLKGSDFFMW